MGVVLLAVSLRRESLSCRPINLMIVVQNANLQILIFVYGCVMAVDILRQDVRQRALTLGQPDTFVSSEKNSAKLPHAVTWHCFFHC